MAANLRESVSKIFGNTIVADEKLVEELVSICQTYNMDPQDLLYKWEALNFRPSATRSEISPFTMDSIGALKETLRRELAKSVTKRPQRGNPTGRVATINRSRAPVNAARRTNAGPLSGGLVLAGGAQIKMERHTVVGPSTVVFRGPKMDALSRKERSYRYMYEKISERSEALDERIDEFGELIREHYNIGELGDPSSSTDEEVVIIGRITHDFDSATSGSKLTDATVTVESSRMHGSGARISLRFDPGLKIRGGAHGSGGLGLFPGAIAAFKGRNGGGGWFLATEILAIPPLKPPPPSLGLTSSKMDGDPNENPFSMYIVSGPYSQDSDLEYKPWNLISKRIKAAKPDVILLIGPFIDTLHPKIKIGDIDDTPADLFQSKIIEPLRMVLDSIPGCIAIIVPSVRDLVSKRAVFPQSEFGPELTGGDPRIRLLPNPARFSINSVTFAVSSVDVLFHLRKDEFVKNGVEVDPIPRSSEDDTGRDSMANLCRHMLQQRSFYPIFPVPLDVSHEVNLDVSHSQPGLRLGAGNELNGDDYAPDVLILPSRLKHFSKSVHTTTVINPSFCVKNTYAVLKVAGKGMAENTKGRIQTEVIKVE